MLEGRKGLSWLMVSEISVSGQLVPLRGAVGSPHLIAGSMVESSFSLHGGQKANKNRKVKSIKRRNKKEKLRDKFDSSILYVGMEISQ
jgi:RNA-splicing ligase RtcB